MSNSSVTLLLAIVVSWPMIAAAHRAMGSKRANRLKNSETSFIGAFGKGFSQEVRL